MYVNKPPPIVTTASHQNTSYPSVAFLRANTQPTVSVVIPTLNEADNLPYVLPRIPSWIDEIVLVDGHSTDGTVDVAQALCPGIRVITQEPRGKGAALRAGFAAAKGDIIVMIDADGSTDPREITAYVGALLSGAEFAKGSRFLQGGGTADMPLIRRIGNLCFVLIVRLFFGGKFSDLCYGYNAFWRRVLPSLQLDSNGFEIETMMNIRALRAGLKVVEISSFEHERIHGKGYLKTIPDGWRILKTILRERLRRQQKWVSQKEKDKESPPEVFAALDLIQAEAKHLSLRRHSLSNDAYQRAYYAVEAARQELIEMQIHAPPSEKYPGYRQIFHSSEESHQGRLH